MNKRMNNSGGMGRGLKEGGWEDGRMGGWEDGRMGIVNG